MPRLAADKRIEQSARRRKSSDAADFPPSLASAHRRSGASEQVSALRDASAATVPGIDSPEEWLRNLNDAIEEDDQSAPQIDIATAEETDLDLILTIRRPASRRLRKTTRHGRIKRLLTAVAGLARQTRQAIVRYCATHRQQLKTVGASFGIHLGLMVVLGLWVLPPGFVDESFFVIGETVAPLGLDDIPVDVPDVVFPESLKSHDTNSEVRNVLSELNRAMDTVEFASVEDREFALPVDPAKKDERLPVDEGHFSGRSAAGKQKGLQKYGGTAESERAVNLGLKWLASIQQKDGSWNFAQVGGAEGAGTLNTTDMGATSLAMLCFLGAGHTHLSDGPYRQVVASGLEFMLRSARRQSTGTDLTGLAQQRSAMYVQGLATIVLCEASAMEPRDKTLLLIASEAIAFIERTRDTVGGGWRYVPRQPGDTSVTGWQIMALQSAKAGGIKVSSSVLRDARVFLDSVDTDGGAKYGYTRPQSNRPTMTAVGLLCRMYMGWKRDRSGIQRGVEYLATLGPSREDIYYNYYATQVVRHFGGDVWKQWNQKLRQQLIETQIAAGPAAGSWDVTDPHGRSGGSIYKTALSILTLEVYYRHLPLYRELEQNIDPDAAADEP